MNICLLDVCDPAHLVCLFCTTYVYMGEKDQLRRCPELKRNEKNSLASNIFQRMRMSLFFGNEFFFAEAVAWRWKLPWWIKRQRLHEKCFVIFFRNTTVQEAPGGRKTRVVLLTHDNCVSGETIAIFFVSWFSEVNRVSR